MAILATECVNMANEDLTLRSSLAIEKVNGLLN